MSKKLNIVLIIFSVLLFIISFAYTFTLSIKLETSGSEFPIFWESSKSLLKLAFFIAFLTVLLGYLFSRSKKIVRDKSSFNILLTIISCSLLIQIAFFIPVLNNYFDTGKITVTDARVIRKYKYSPGPNKQIKVSMIELALANGKLRSLNLPAFMVKKLELETLREGERIKLLFSRGFFGIEMIIKVIRQEEE